MLGHRSSPTLAPLHPPSRTWCRTKPPAQPGRATFPQASHGLWQQPHATQITQRLALDAQRRNIEVAIATPIIAGELPSARCTVVNIHPSDNNGREGARAIANNTVWIGQAD